MGEARNAQEVDAFLTQAESMGYEGIMLRDGTTPYEPGKRSSSLYKAKRFETDEFEIVAVKEATKKDAGTPVFECAVAGAKKFSARPTGTMEERRKMWEARDTYIGKMLTVKFQGVSTTGIPRFPVAIGVRDYE
jgi:DNA ligase-1